MGWSKLTIIPRLNCCLIGVCCCSYREAASFCMRWPAILVVLTSAGCSVRGTTSTASLSRPLSHPALLCHFMLSDGVSACRAQNSNAQALCHFFISSRDDIDVEALLSWGFILFLFFIFYYLYFFLVFTINKPSNLHYTFFYDIYHKRIVCFFL